MNRPRTAAPGFATGLLAVSAGLCAAGLLSSGCWRSGGDRPGFKGGERAAGSAATEDSSPVPTEPGKVYVPPIPEDPVRFDPATATATVAPGFNAPISESVPTRMTVRTPEGETLSINLRPDQVIFNEKGEYLGPKPGVVVEAGFNSGFGTGGGNGRDPQGLEKKAKDAALKAAEKAAQEEADLKAAADKKDGNKGSGKSGY